MPWNHKHPVLDSFLWFLEASIVDLTLVMVELSPTSFTNISPLSLVSLTNQVALELFSKIFSKAVFTIFS